MPAVNSNFQTLEQAERTARNTKLEKVRKERLNKNIEAALACTVCASSYVDAHKNQAYVLGCGHSYCGLCVAVNLPAMYMARNQPLACPACRQTFPGTSYEATRNFSLNDIASSLSDAVNPDKRVRARDMSPELDAADLAASSPGPGDAARAPTVLYVSPAPEDAARAATALYVSPGPGDAARAPTVLYVSPAPEDAARAATALRVSPGPAEDNREGTVLYQTAAAQREERGSTLPYVSPALPAVLPVPWMARLRRQTTRYCPY